jgi:hypothetical protein
MSKKLLLPDQVKDWLVRRYNNQHRAWLEGGGEWPLSVPLGLPTQADVSADYAATRAWVDSWARWNGPGTLETEERSWARLGDQRLPAAVMLAGPSDVAAWCGQDGRWQRATARHASTLERWPELRARVGSLGKYFDVFADYSDVDFGRLLAVVSWFLANPSSGLYVRQLPVVGVDTKWLEKRTSLVTDLLALLREGEVHSDFFAATGMRRLPHRVRLRVLCSKLRASVGGLSDIEAPLEELAALTLQPSAVLVVENRESGVALPDMEGVVAFVGLGNAVPTLAAVPWLRDVPASYWGDIDTHGLAILSLARTTLPGIRSVLMDFSTLEAFKELAVQEQVQATDARLSELSADERALFDGLRAGTWGTKLRLEQERLPWPVVLEALMAGLCTARPESLQGTAGARCSEVVPASSDGAQPS